MMSHDQAHPLIDAFLDGELGAVESADFEGHARQCRQCQDLLAARRALLERLRRAPLRYPLPAGSERRLLASLPAAPAPRARRMLSSLPLPAALAASLVLAVGAYWAGHRHGDSRLAAEAFASAHVRSMLAEARVEVLSSDHHTVRPWFTGRLSFAPPVPELAADGYSLVGGRVDYVDHVRCAALVYRAGAHWITVFVAPNDSGWRSGDERTREDGYQVIRASTGTFRMVTVTDMADAETRRFVDRWLAAAAG